MIANRPTDAVPGPAPPTDAGDDDGMGPIGPEMAAWLKDLKWIDDHYVSELVPRYANKFVGVVDARVVASGDSRMEVGIRAAQLAGVPESRVVVDFIEWVTP